MSGPATQRYLETEVLTAPAQKLQLMLIEAAIRFTQRARQQMKAGDAEETCELLIRAQQIVTEMLTGLNRDVDAALTKKVAAVYLFIFRRLTEANVEHDPRKLDDALRILQIERETWAEVCRQTGSAWAPGGTGNGNATDSQDVPRTPHLPTATPAQDASPGLSLEA